MWSLEDLSVGGDWDQEPDEEDLDPREEFADELTGHEIAGLGVRVDGVAAIAGRLPEGAASVEVRDGSDRPVPVEVAEGVWLALPDPPAGLDPVVLFKAVDGSPVRRPLPDWVTVEPLPDADEACPSCGAQSWEVASASEDGPRFVYEFEPGDRAAVCATCGYKQSLPRLGGVIHETVVQAEKLSPAERQARWESHRRDLWERATRDLGQPPIGLLHTWRGERRIGGWGGGVDGHPITSFELEHGDGCYEAGGLCVSVTTSVYRMDKAFQPVEEWLEQNLVALLSDEWREGSVDSEPAAELREKVRRRRVEERVHALGREQVASSLDGEPVSLVRIGDDDAWCGYVEHGGVAITVVARSYPSSQLALESARVELYLAR